MASKTAHDKLEKFLAAALNPKRLRHSRSCSALARSLARTHGADEERAAFAGLAHDMAKDLPTPDQGRLARECQRALLDSGREGLPPELLESPKLMHGPAADALLRTRFGVADEEVLEAVRCHTLGSPGMGTIAKIVYVADKIEPERTEIAQEFRRSCLESALDGALLIVVGRAMELSAARGRAVAPVTLSLYNSLRGG
jgi:nicotinate-nucleotide adenylyltransferase